MVAELARKAHASVQVRDTTRFRAGHHLAAGTAIEVISQREDARVLIRLLDDPTQRLYVVPADAIDPRTARAMKIHRPARHRRSSGGTGHGMLPAPQLQQH